MRSATFLLAALAAFAAATPQSARSSKGVCTKTLRGTTSTVTSTVYTSTTTTTSFHYKGTVTSVSTTTAPPAITSCANPRGLVTTSQAAGSQAVAKRKVTSTVSRNCHSTTTITEPSTKTTVTVSTVSTVTRTSTVATTTTSIATATNTALATGLTDLPGIWYITNQVGGFFTVTLHNDETYFPIELQGGGNSMFNLTDGALTVVAGEVPAGDVLYYDATNSYNNGFPNDAVQALSASAASGQGSAAAPLSCTVSQNSDGTCPISCTSTGGSKFYYCGNIEESYSIFIGGAAPADCGNTGGYNPQTAWFVST